VWGEIVNFNKETSSSIKNEKYFYTQIDNILEHHQDIKYKLEKISIFKEEITNRLKELEQDIEYEDFVRLLSDVGFTFEEFSKYSQHISTLIDYSNKNSINTLNEYLELLYINERIPQWLKNTTIVSDVMESFLLEDINEVLNFKIEVNDYKQLSDLIGKCYLCREKLSSIYNELIQEIYDTFKSEINEISGNKSDLEYKVGTIAEEVTQKKELSVKELYDKYIWKKGYLVDCKVKEVKANKIIIDIENEVIGEIKEESGIKPLYNYKVGDIITACISIVVLNNNKLHIELSRKEVNFVRQLFNKLREEIGLAKCIVKFCTRKQNYKTMIVLAFPNSVHYEIELSIIKDKMEKQLEGEKIDLVVYSKDLKQFMANILHISPDVLSIDEINKKCRVRVDRDSYLDLENRIKNENYIIKKVTGYNLEMIS
jgi:transcription termination/antitermination protein NusA